MADLIKKGFPQNEESGNTETPEFKESADFDKIAFNKALKNAVTILSHADNTKKQLIEKLQKKGHKKEVIYKVVDHLCQKGYLNETDYLCRAVHYFAETKLYGKRRIYIELLRKGFDKKIIEENFEICTNDVDFIKNCAILIEKKSSYYSDKKKSVNALIRYGYTTDEIREAYRIYEEQDDK